MIIIINRIKKIAYLYEKIFRIWLNNCYHNSLYTTSFVNNLFLLTICIKYSVQKLKLINLTDWKRVIVEFGGWFDNRKGHHKV